MRGLLAAVGLASMLACTNAHAGFFFFFIPGSVVGKIGDAFTGSEGEQCVRGTAKVGDVLTSPAGNTATVKSLSGTSSKCQDPNLPIRARLEFVYNFSSKAGIDLPEGFEPLTLTDIQRFDGALLKAEDKKSRGIFITVVPRSSNVDVETRAFNVATRMSSFVDKYAASNAEILKVGELKAARIEVRGNNKNLFARSYVYVVTVLESDKEIVVVNAWSPSEDDVPMLRQMASKITGLTAPAEPLPVAAAPASATSAPIAEVKAVPVATVAPAPVPVAALVPVVAAPVPEPTPVPADRPVADKPSPTVTATPLQTSGTAGQTIPDKLRELDKLRKEGVITQREFDAKKMELLKAL